MLYGINGSDDDDIGSLKSSTFQKTSSSRRLELRMTSEFTKNYNLDLYTDNDKPNLRDQYNGAITKIDTQLYEVSNNLVVVTEAANQAKDKANENATEIADEVTRAKGAEQNNATAIEQYRQEVLGYINAISNAQYSFNTRNDLINTVLDIPNNTIVKVYRYNTNSVFIPAYYLIANGSVESDSPNVFNLKENNSYATLVVPDNKLYVAWFGAIPNTGDSTSAVQACIDYAVNTDTQIIDFDNSRYYVSNLTVPETHGLTFQCSYTDVQQAENIKAGIYQLSSGINNPMITIGTAGSAGTSYSINVNFQNIAIVGTTNSIQGLRLLNCARGYFTHTNISNFYTGIFANALYDYSFDDVYIFGCGKANTENIEYAGIYLNADLARDNCNACHFSNCHFESNYKHLSGNAILDNHFTNCKFEDGVSNNSNNSIEFIGDLTKSVNWGYTSFVNCFFSTNATNSGHFIHLFAQHGIIISDCQFIGSFTNKTPIWAKNTFGINIHDNQIYSYTSFPDDYAIWMHNAQRSQCHSNTLRTYTSHTNKIHAYCVNSIVENNISVGDSSSNTIIDFGGEGNVINQPSIYQSLIPNNSINGLTPYIVSKDINFNEYSNTTLFPNVLIINANNVTIDMPSKNQGVQFMIMHAVGNYSYTVNSNTSDSSTFTGNTYWVYLSNIWYVFGNTKSNIS